MSLGALWQKKKGTDSWSALHAGLNRVLGVPWVRPALRWAWRGALACYLVFFLLLVVLRYLVLPAVPGHQSEIEQAASSAIGMPVKIEKISAGWQGINPKLTLDGVRLMDRKGQPALAFNRVESVLSWRSLWHLKPILALLAVDGPVLHIRRDREGGITIAGVSAEGQGDRSLADWFFEQRRIRIRDATIVWEDALRGALPLVLDDLQFTLDNRGERHLFGLSALPPPRLAARLQIRGDVRGNPMDGLEQLSGRVFAELDYADLAGWRAWIDYPVRLEQGRGALRVWGDWTKGKGGAVADVALEDVRIQFGRDLPQLDLASMRGRLQGKYVREAWQFGGRQIELSTLSGIRVPPTDFEFSWRQISAGREGGNIAGTARANFVDLHALQQLAAYLPLDARSRELLKTHQPQGRIIDLRASWQVEGEQVQDYELQARFEELGMQAAGYFPGGSGLSGEVKANERGGTLTLQSKACSLDLPFVFPEPTIALSELRGKANWRIHGDVLDTRLERLEFSGPDATGTAQGSYRYDGKGPGVVDLTAALTRGDGRSVWRYMPHVVHSDVREWLKHGITGGTASEAKLRLKGDLRYFPFEDKSKGEFLITAKAHGAEIDYGPGWPKISGIDADLSFGSGMQINARTGTILGAAVGPVSARIPSFSAAEEELLIEGRAAGPTAEFLRFIEASPLPQSLKSRTMGLRAAGEGKLALKLHFPLRHMEKTGVQGEFTFQENQLTIMPGLPPLTQLGGRIEFTEQSVAAREVSGQAFGAPLQLDIRSEGEVVSITASGGVVMRELRKAYDHPVFDSLSGQSTWKGEMRMQKNLATFVIDSDLVGIASSLPEPFNKSARAHLPLRFEKGELAQSGGGDRLRLVLRDVAELELLRRQKGVDLIIERGALSVGTPLPQMPVRGITAAVRVARVDGDFWRRLLAGGKRSQSASSFPLEKIGLNTPSLRLFGRDFNQVELEALRQAEGWRIGLNAAEASGELVWNSAGKGILKADFKRLAIPAGEGGGTSIPDGADESLPGLDIRVADFSLGGKPLGELKAVAHNQGGTWSLDSLQLTNPDGVLKGKGEWATVGGHRTRLNFQLTARDIGKLLDRLKIAVAVRRGTASLEGDLAWQGPLAALHYPSLSGELIVRAKNGQFSKLEPGIGKLLGLISLQSLPRRLILDFRDVFSEGFAFDSIEGKLIVTNGVLRTQDTLKIDGPAARVLIKGEADLKAETQDLEVTVQPEMGGVAAVGGAVALANPLVGAGVWLASKVLQDPLNRMFAYQYRVTGAWNDPKVEKVGQAAPQRAPSEYYGAPGAPQEGAR